ncbi:MAG: glycosyltransferase family 4 protein [Bacteroidetes bacterium]|nr:glycosyltransferase family 4 protein [Bacteroidota bacterium]
MKILFVATQINGNGGIPRFKRNLIKQLKSRENTTVEVVSLNDSEKEYNGAGKNKIKFLFTFIRVMIRFKPDQVVLGHIHLVKLARFKFLFPSAYWHSILYGIEVWFKRDELLKHYPSISRYWAISNYTKAKFAETNNIALDKIKLIVLTTPSDWDPKELVLTDSSFFLSVSRLDKSEGYKGIDKTIEAIYQNKAEMQSLGYKYVIVAAGDDLPRHVDMVKNYNLSDIISIKSGVSDVELKELYRTTSCSILPSSGEGFGFIFLEAMAFKKACIGCKNCGSEDLIEHDKTGYLVEPKVEDIWKHMRLLMLDPAKSKAMGEAGYIKREKEFKGARTEDNIKELLCVE